MLLADYAPQVERVSYALYAEHKGSCTQVDMMKATEVPYILETAHHYLLQALPHAVEVPVVIVLVLHPLEVGDRNAAGIGKHIGNDEHALVSHGAFGFREPGIDERADWDLEQQTLTLSVRGTGGESTMTLWWLEPERWNALLAEAGFAVDECYGWFDRTPYDGGEDTIWIAHR